MKSWWYLPCAVLLAACGSTNGYVPPPGATGAQMWAQACARCHRAIGEFRLAQRKADAAFIANMVATGNASMPAFPNIRGAALEELSMYVIGNSARR